MSVAIEPRGRVLLVTLRRPECRNAVDPEAAAASHDAFRARPAPAELARGLVREWASIHAWLAAGATGAARFVSGQGRGGRH
jgi:enoyl-CoA hydratase